VRNDGKIQVGRSFKHNNWYFDLAFYIGAVLSILAAIASLLRGKVYIYGEGEKVQPVSSTTPVKPVAGAAAVKTEDSSEQTKSPR